MKVTLVSVFPDLTAFGLRHIGACLSEAGHDVQIIFLPDDDFEEICSVPGRYEHRYPESAMNQIEELSKGSELACISLFSCYIPQAIQLSKRFKEMKIPVLWGGKHPSALPEDSLQYADMVCIGEGELAIKELVRRMEAGEDYFDTEGFHFNTPEGIKENGAAKLVEDLDTLPWIDYDFCPHYVWEKEKDVLFPGTKMYEDYWEVRDTKFPGFELDYIKLYKEYRRTYLNFIFQLLNHRVPRPVIRLLITKPFIYLFEEKGAAEILFILRDFLRATGTLNIVKSLRRIQAVRGQRRTAETGVDAVQAIARA